MTPNINSLDDSNTPNTWNTSDAMACEILAGKTARNSEEFTDYSNSGPFSRQDFDQNFVFPIVKYVLTKSEHIPTVLKYFPPEEEQY